MTEPLQTEIPVDPKPPTPGDVAERQRANSEQPAEEAEADDKTRNPQDYESEIAKLRKENASWRTKYREAEPIVKAHTEAQEAAKTEVQRATERADALEREKAELQVGYTRLEVAAQYNISPDNIDLIGSGSREEMEGRASRLAQLSAVQSPTQRPPSDRPVEGLRPGASPEPPAPEDNSYPASWGFQRQPTS